MPSSPRSASPSLVDSFLGILDRLFGRPARPAAVPVLVPVTTRRPHPVRVPSGRR